MRVGIEDMQDKLWAWVTRSVSSADDVGVHESEMRKPSRYMRDTWDAEQIEYARGEDGT